MSLLSRLLVLLIASWCAPSLLYAAEGADAIAKVFKHKTLKADFVQKVYDSRRELQQTMHGRLALHRPGRFRWSYQSPYEQEIVADGKKVWMYDIDLEQVTVRHQVETVGGTPALLLSSRDEWRNDFNVATVDRGDALTWYELTPKKEDGTFEHLYLAIKDNQFQRLEIQDSFGQTTELHFTNVQLNPVIDDEVFEFVVPDDVDVLDETEM
ncbi:outer membrane lipoprotein chaperone LolA [Pseudomonadota bacterium]